MLRDQYIPLKWQYKVGSLLLKFSLWLPWNTSFDETGLAWSFANGICILPLCRKSEFGRWPCISGRSPEGPALFLASPELDLIPQPCLPQSILEILEILLVIKPTKNVCLNKTNKQTNPPKPPLIS